MNKSDKAQYSLLLKLYKLQRIQDMVSSAERI